MRLRALALVVLLAASGSAVAGVTCSGTPFGLLCVRDDDANGLPERATLYPSADPPVLAFEFEHRAGYSGASASRGEQEARASSVDSDADGAAERREAHVAAWAPSRIGVVAAAWLLDRNDSGTPDRVDTFAYSSHYGESRQRVGIPLP